MKKQPFVPADLYRLVTASDPQIAPDRSVYYVRSTFDEAGDTTLSAIWRAALGREPAAFTSGKKDRMPRLSPDGARLAFVGDRGDGNRIYLMGSGGGEARAVTGAYPAIGALVWSPDSARIAFTATVTLDPATARIAHDKRSGARHIRGLPFKSDEDGLLDGRRKHLHILELSDEAEPRRITHGDYDVGVPSWSPDCRRLAFAAQIGFPEHSFSSDIFVVERENGGLRKLTASKGQVQTPAFSHSGREIAFVGHEHGDIFPGRYHAELFVIESEGGAPRSLSAPTDRSVGNVIVGDARGPFAPQAPVWSEDDVRLLVLLSNEGACGIAAFSREGGLPEIVAGGERDIHAFSRAPDGTIAFVYSDPLTPSELMLLASEGERKLTGNNPWLEERAVVTPRRLRPLASDGTRLDLFLLDPICARGDQPQPLVLQVHGGPHAAYGFSFFLEFQILAGHGIGVAYGNPRGSQSYAQHYADGVRGDWGGVDVADALALLDAAEVGGAWDRSRIGVAGGSYGGFMTTCLLGRSKRFAAGVSMRAVNDFVSEVGASDCGWFLEDELNLAWDGGRELFDRSPMRRAHAIEAPLLILHSERDYRCPIDQGEQLFTLLRRLGRTNVEFVRFTGDGHSLSRAGKPRNRVLRLRAIAHWLIRYLRPEGIGMPAGASADAAGWLFEPLLSEAAVGKIGAQDLT